MFSRKYRIQKSSLRPGWNDRAAWLEWRKLSLYNSSRFYVYPVIAEVSRDVTLFSNDVGTHERAFELKVYIVSDLFG